MPRSYSTTRAEDLFARANPLRRVRGFLVDAGLAVILFVPLVLASVWASGLPSELQPWAVGVAVLALPSWWLVQSVRLGRQGQTEGMRRAGVWLVDARTGRPAGVLRAGVLRRALYLVYLVPGLGTLLAIVDALALARRNGRTLLDRLTGTVVLGDVDPTATPRIQAAHQNASRADLASISQRARALATDLALSGAFWAPTVAIALLAEDGARPDLWMTLGGLALACLPVVWLVQSVRLGRRGQTVGMERTDVWVVDARSLQPAGVGRALARRALLIFHVVPILGVPLLVLDVLVFLREDGRALLDRLTGTLALCDPPDSSS